MTYQKPENVTDEFVILETWWIDKLRGKTVLLKHNENETCEKLPQQIKRELEKDKNTHVIYTDDNEMDYRSHSISSIPDVIVVVAFFVTRIALDADIALNATNVESGLKEKTMLLIFHKVRRDRDTRKVLLTVYKNDRVSDTIHVPFKDRPFYLKLISEFWSWISPLREKQRYLVVFGLLIGLFIFLR